MQFYWVTQNRVLFPYLCICVELSLQIVWVWLDDDHIFYPLATGEEEEMEEWMSILKQAIGMEVE